MLIWIFVSKHVAFNSKQDKFFVNKHAACFFRALLIKYNIMRDLAEKLTLLRKLRGETLRTVEAKTGISNAYLSQMENGKVEKPRPHVLHKLAEYYGVRYEDLMAAAGYLTRGDEERPEDSELAEIQLMSAGLSDEQKKILKRFIRFLQQSQEEES